jgi:uncharacterized alpha-E superfamily protein
VLLSRVADALYWMSRYLERAEHTARVVDVRVDLALDRRHGTRVWDFERLYASLRLPVGAGLPANPAALTDAVFFDPAHPDSLWSCLTTARENARQVREEISADMWEQINRLYLRVRQLRTEGLVRPHYVSRLVIEGVHLFQGITDATMGHGEGWHYLQVGRFLERAASGAVLLDRYLSDGAAARGSRSDPGEGVALLRSASALEAYCRHYTADLRPDRIAEFLLLNPEFPRSVRFAAARVEQSLRTMADLASRGANGRAVRLAGRLHASLDYGQMDEILGEDPHAYLEGITRQCAQVHAAVYQSYVAYPIESALPA